VGEDNRIDQKKNCLRFTYDFIDLPGPVISPRTRSQAEDHLTDSSMPRAVVDPAARVPTLNIA
jgi:hypothetical protein